MIYALPGQPITAVLQSAPTGLTGVIGVRIEKSDGTNHTPRTTAGIVEVEADSGIYVKDDLVAPDEKATYVVVWDTGGGTPTFASEELLVATDLPTPAPPIGDITWAPSVDDVAALLQARLAKRGGGMAQTFDDTTRPTAQQVEKLIARGVQAVVSRVGADPCSDELKDMAGSTAAIYTAMLVEQSYYPGQTRDAGSSFQSLLSLWKDDIKALDSRVAEECGEGGGAGGSGGDNRTGVGYFDTLPLVGRSYPDW